MTSVSISVVDLILGVLNVSRVYPHVSLNSSVLPQTILIQYNNLIFIKVRSYFATTTCPAPHEVEPISPRGSVNCVGAGRDVLGSFPTLRPREEDFLRIFSRPLGQCSVDMGSRSLKGEECTRTTISARIAPGTSTGHPSRLHSGCLCTLAQLAAGRGSVDALGRQVVQRLEGFAHPSQSRWTT